MSQPEHPVITPDVYSFEDHQADLMGNSHSTDAPPGVTPMDVDNAGPAAIHRVQGVTGAAKTDAKPRVRGPKAEADSFPFLQASVPSICAPFYSSGRRLMLLQGQAHDQQSVACWCHTALP